MRSGLYYTACSHAMNDKKKSKLLMKTPNLLFVLCMDGIVLLLYLYAKVCNYSFAFRNSEYLVLGR